MEARSFEAHRHDRTISMRRRHQTVDHQERENGMSIFSAIRLAATGGLLVCLIAFPAFALENKEIAKQFADAFASGDTTTLRQLVAENVTDHGSPPGTMPGRQGLLEAVAMFRAWFPDLKVM